MKINKCKTAILVATITTSFFSIANDKQKANIDILKNGVNTYQFSSNELDVPIPYNIKHSFDVEKAAQFNNALRYIDMHLEAGVKPQNIKVSIVIHGNAVNTVIKNQKDDKVLNVLMNSGLVDVYICGQTLTKRGYKKEDLKKGVKLSLSAMTAHHYLQQKGYSYNPF